MSSTEHRTEPDTAAPPAPEPEQHAAYHPSAREYIRVGLLLIALTCIEVMLSYSSLAGTKLIVALFTCTVIKFVTNGFRSRACGSCGDRRSCFRA